MVLQKTYIGFLNFIYAAWIENMESRKKNACVWTVFVLIAVYFILLFSNVFYTGFLSTNNQREILFLILLLIAAVFSMDGKLRIVEWNRWISWLTIAGGIGLILTRILHPTGDGYLMFGVMLLTVYPIFYLVWNNRKDYETLFDIIAGSNVAVCTLYVLYNFLNYADNYSAHFFDRRFKGTTWNANLYSMIGLTLLCASLYLIYRNKNNIKRAVLFVITAAMGLTVILLGKSRATIVIAVLVLISVVVFGVKKRAEFIAVKNKKLLASIAVMLIMCILCMIRIGSMTSDSISDEEYNPKVISERFSTEGKDADEFTSGRLSMWKIYAGMLNLTGNDVDAIDWDSLPVSQAAHCHNNFLEYGYRCGVPVSLIFTALELFACMIGFIYLFSRRLKRDALLFPIIFTEMYFVNSLIDIATLPCERYAPFFFYLILAIMIDPRPNAEREEKHKEKPRVIYSDGNNPV